MKKTLLAICITVASASTIAADSNWSTGNFNGTIEIGGTIDKTQYPAKWEWRAGDSFSELNASTKDLMENGTKLTIPVTENKPILLGRTAEAFSAHMTGVEAAPKIAFKGFDGALIDLQASGSSDGTHYLELPIKKQNENDKIGSLRINVTAAGVVAKEKNETTADLNSIDANTSGDIFFGGLVSSSVIESASDAATKTAAFGSLSAEALLNQVQVATNKNLTLAEGTAKQSETMADGKVTAAAYAMAVANGQSLIAKFNETISSETRWTAPLSIEVSYQ